MRLDPSLLPASVRPWFVPLTIWRESMATISAKAAARLEAVQLHLAGMPLLWRDGFVVVRIPDEYTSMQPPREVVLPCDFKRPVDLDAVLANAEAIAHELPREWAIRPLVEYPDWYRRPPGGFRIPVPPRWEIVCNVYYCPGGKWGEVPAIDLGAVSA